jgi:hypothetical protein
MDSFREARDAAVQNLKSVKDRANQSLDDGISTASSTARSSIVVLKQGAETVYQETEVSTILVAKSRFV